MLVRIVELAAVVQEECFGLGLAMATKLPVAGLESLHEKVVDVWEDVVEGIDLAFDQNVEVVAENHLAGACAFDVAARLLDAYAAEVEDMIDGPSQHEQMSAASEAGH